MSLVIAVAGLWLALSQAGTAMAAFGWLLLALGLGLAAVNLSLRGRGYRMPRRRP